ncbi:hypothetical protein [Mobiluncus curtisii]|uniref:Uncharacterized protein n=2 Tax=Mobiluncus curtisii TaxID=2051 RepID=D6ZG26_MOBCV|nr:hypothetical protein [Mobiluncus curtisii]ADI67584.1 hypothetical protein HMPREF0573_11265 [Mobiluncus curtisii ATCC 43063]NMW89524.1 hypothetical protein [Mobiluncus curtisii]SQB65089.1 Uncharacterised protein [Mobiluncus curtisii]
MRKTKHTSLLGRLIRKATGRTDRVAVGKHRKPRVEPQTVNLVDDDDDLMALAKALYPERYGMDVKESVK